MLRRFLKHKNKQDLIISTPFNVKHHTKGPDSPIPIKLDTSAASPASEFIEMVCMEALADELTNDKSPSIQKPDLRPSATQPDQAVEVIARFTDDRIGDQAIRRGVKVVRPVVRKMGSRVTVVPTAQVTAISEARVQQYNVGQAKSHLFCLAFVASRSRRIRTCTNGCTSTKGVERVC